MKTGRVTPNQDRGGSVPRRIPRRADPTTPLKSGVAGPPTRAGFGMTPSTVEFVFKALSKIASVSSTGGRTIFLTTSMECYAFRCGSCADGNRRLVSAHDLSCRHGCVLRVGGRIVRSVAEREAGGGRRTAGRARVVSAASYAARKFGVHSAMPLRTAAKLCPQAIFVDGHPERYREYSQKVFEVLMPFLAAGGDGLDR